MAGTKRKIAMVKRETKAQRSVAFSKRRRGLFQKAADLCLLSGASVAVLATPPSDKPDIYSFGHPSTDNVVDAFLSGRRPTPTETGDFSVVAKLGLGFLLETQNGDDPEELQCLIERTSELRLLRSTVAALLKARGRKSASSEPSNSALEADVNDGEIFTGFSGNPGYTGFGNADFDCFFSTDSKELTVFSYAGTEANGNPVAIETDMTYGGLFGPLGNGDFGNCVFDYGLSQDCS